MLGFLKKGKIDEECEERLTPLFDPFEQMLNCPHEFAPNLDKFTPDGPAPVMPDADGRYRVPMPGVNWETEYKV